MGLPAHAGHAAAGARACATQLVADEAGTLRTATLMRVSSSSGSWLASPSSPPPPACIHPAAPPARHAAPAPQCAPAMFLKGVTSPPKFFHSWCATEAQARAAADGGCSALACQAASTNWRALAPLRHCTCEEAEQQRIRTPLPLPPPRRNLFLLGGVFSSTTLLTYILFWMIAFNLTHVF